MSLQSNVALFCVLLLHLLLVSSPNLAQQPPEECEPDPNPPPCDFTEIIDDPDKEKGLVNMCDAKSSPENHFIYCSGKLLQAVNYHGLLDSTGNKTDSKDFVDRPMKKEAHEVQKEFETKFAGKAVKDYDKGELQKFVDDHFHRSDDTSTALISCGDEVPGYTDKPATLLKIADPAMQKWALELHARWKTLCRQIPQSANNRKMNSLIYVPHKFVVPGGRFREYYYWDSYWTIIGLLASELDALAKEMLQNFAYLIKEHSFVPNGGRVYYLQRSQPPLLISMVDAYYSETKDVEYLKEVLPTLEKELSYWSGQMATVNIDGKDFEMYHYSVNSTVPRPESFCDDVRTAMSMQKRHKTGCDQPHGSDQRLDSDAKDIDDYEAAKRLWRNLASSAESGWDFGTRWFLYPENPMLEQVRTSKILQVDLNAYICGNMRLMAKFYHQIGEDKKALEYHSQYQVFRDKFQKVFFVDEDGKPGWYDYNLDTKKHNVHFYGSMVVPLFMGCYEPTDVRLPERIYQTMDAFGALKFENGIPTSMQETGGQQWDHPNVWPPLQHMAVEGFRRSGSKDMQDKAVVLARNFVLANYKEFNRCVEEKVMWEKLSVLDGQPGRGGEYAPQKGFGWSNGVVLDFLVKYNEHIKFEGTLPAPTTCFPGEQHHH